MPQFTTPRPALLVRAAKPRNPFVADCQRRQAGRHQAPHARQQAQHALRSEMRHLTHPPTTD